MYASMGVTFHIVLRHSRRFSITPITYRLTLLLTVLTIYHRLHPRSILPLLCSKHHSSVLWLDYHSSTSLHSCG